MQFLGHSQSASGLFKSHLNRVVVVGSGVVVAAGVGPGGGVGLTPGPRVAGGASVEREQTLLGFPLQGQLREPQDGVGLTPGPRVAGGASVDGVPHNLYSTAR